MGFLDDFFKAQAKFTGADAAEDESAEQTATKQFLAYLWAKKTFSVPELQKEFGLDYLTVKRAVDELLHRGYIKFESGVQYSATDKCNDQDGAEEKGDEDDDDDILGEEGSLHAQRARFEARRREFAKRWSGVGEEDDEAAAAEPFDEDDDDDEGIDDETAPDQIYDITQRFDDGIAITEEEEGYFIAPRKVELDGIPVRFKIMLHPNGDVWLSDDALASLTLHTRVPFESTGVSEHTGAVIKQCGVSVVGDELRIKVECPEDTVPCMMRLYTAIERIVTVDEEAVAIRAEYIKETEKLWEVAKQFLKDDPKLDRGQLIIRMRERYRAVKDGDNIDEIALYARGVKEFAGMTDEVYRQSRDIITGQKKPQGTGGEKKESETPSEEGADPAETGILLWNAAEVSGNIIKTLKSFRIDAEMVNVAIGPSVLRFELDVPADVPASAVIKRQNELAMRLGLPDVRIYDEAESGRIFIEVARAASERDTVKADDLVRPENAIWGEKNALMFAVGKDVAGEPVYGDISRLKHILVGGAAGSGKTTFLHTMIYSFITRYSPDDVRLILCDPKHGEFACYRGMPHLLTGQIVTEPDQMIRALNWAIGEMERRYRLFERKTAGGTAVRNVDEYNAARNQNEKQLPRIVLIADEYADFILPEKREFESAVQRLLPKARAAGIHLVLATRKASVNVVTGAIKANFTTRVVFRLSREADSRILLDESGAEKLLGSGDLLMRGEADFRCTRVQGAYLTPEMTEAAVAADKEAYAAKFHEMAKRFIKGVQKPAATSSDTEEDDSADPLYIKALAIAIKEGEVSISFIQRKCCVGYNHAGKIIEWMEHMGYITPFEGSKGRRVLMTRKQFIKKYGPLY